MKKFNLKRISELETLEEKSFWIIAPTISILGLISMGTGAFFDSWFPTVSSALLCLILPMIFMLIAPRLQNYHVAYPLLCIVVGAISMPVVFVCDGGYLSGMPLFCVIMTAVTAMCYSPVWRFISLFACLAGNSAAFLYVRYVGMPPFPLSGTEILYEEQFAPAIQAIFNDVFVSYFSASIGMFAVVNFIISDIRRYKVSQDALQQFFDNKKRNEILEKALGADSNAGSNHRKAVILFADIANFTSITENMPSDLISEYLNEFFSDAGNHIHQTGGIIDKYIGDCVMAYWFDSEEGNCVLRAVQSMLDLKQETVQKAEMIYRKYGTELNFSVGIAYGDVIFGDIGSDSMHDFTVIGDAVNTASRLESYAVSGEILLSDEAAAKVKKLIVMENVENDHFFKGKNKPIDLYRVIGVAGEKQTTQLVQKSSHGYVLHICGCRGSFPVSGLRFSEYGGETSCYVIKKDNYAVVIDCGTGLKNAAELLQGCTNIDILLTHMHYDHILGLLMSKFPLDAKVRIFGNFDAWSKDTFEGFMEHPYWPVEIVNTERVNAALGKSIVLEKRMVATFFRSDHPDNACVIVLNCADKKITFLADCEDAEKLEPAIAQGSDILFFDGMFDDNDPVDHRGWGHGTWQAGVRFSEGKDIKKLVITHHNPEVGDHSLMLNEAQARQMAPNVSFAKSGDVFIL